MECKMKNLVIAIVCFIIAVFCVVGMSWGDERKDDDPVQIASLLMLGVDKATFAAPSGPKTWFVLMPSSTDYVLMPSSTDKVKLPGH
jgi:hypothetical protein